MAGIAASLREMVLHLWAGGMTQAEITDRCGVGERSIRNILAAARADGDARAQRRVSPGRPAAACEQAAPAPSREPEARHEEYLAREAREAERVTEAATSRDAQILAALDAEPRPRGVRWGYPEIESAVLAKAPPAPLGPRDVTARFFGDPPPGRSALDMREGG